MLGNEAAGGTPRNSSPFPPHQSSMEALALLQASQSATLPSHVAANGLPSALPLPRPNAAGFGVQEACHGEIGRVSHVELLAAGTGGLAGPRRMSLDSVMPPRPPPPVHMRAGPHGLPQWPSSGVNGGAVDPVMLAALQLSHRAMAMPPLSGRSSMDGPYPREHRLGPAVSLPPPAPGFRDNAMLQAPRARGSLDLPPTGSHGLPDQQTAAGHDFGWPATGRQLPQRRSVDIGSVQRQGHPSLGGDYGMQLHPAHLLNAPHLLLICRTVEPTAAARRCWIVPAHGCQSQQRWLRTSTWSPCRRHLLNFSTAVKVNAKWRTYLAVAITSVCAP